jgi:prophage maintenance system killer protein
MKKETDQIIIYEDQKGESRVEAIMESETIWLTQKQIAKVFDKDVRTVNEHMQNIFSTKELSKESTIRKIRKVQIEGKRKIERSLDHYNLDMVLSVGYRVNSKKATAFRVWANKVLKGYLIEGYSINERKFLEVKEIVRFITEKARSDTLSGHEKEILDVIEKYSKTWSILGQYDEGNIKIKKGRKGKFKLNYYACRDMIDKLKDDLVRKKIVGDLFGQEREETFEAILGNLYQTFDGEDLYSSLEEKAAHLLYFVIKDHPFFDGNKRIGSLLFLSFLEKNSFLFHNDGQVKINDKTIVALALLVASSDPKEKDAMIRLTINLIQD